MLILIAAVCSLVLAAVLERLLIPVLRALKAGQSIREIGPSWHSCSANFCGAVRPRFRLKRTFKKSSAKPISP